MLSILSGSGCCWHTFSIDRSIKYISVILHYNWYRYNRTQYSSKICFTPLTSCWLRLVFIVLHDQINYLKWVPCKSHKSVHPVFYIAFLKLDSTLCLLCQWVPCILQALQTFLSFMFIAVIIPKTSPSSSSSSSSSISDNAACYKNQIKKNIENVSLILSKKFKFYKKKKKMQENYM